MNKIAICFFLFVFSQNANAQLLDKELRPYESIIRDSLETYGDIRGERVDIYSRKIGSLIQDRIVVFEIGLTVSHGYKRLAILSNQKLFIQKGVSIENEIDFLRSIFLKSKYCYKLSDYIELDKKINYIYQFNKSPPWKKD